MWNRDVVICQNGKEVYSVRSAKLVDVFISGVLLLMNSFVI